MADDPEISAMAAVKDALSPLDDETRTHVIRWAAERFGVSLGRIRPGGGAMGGGGGAVEDFEDMGALFHAASPSTDTDKALVGSYWLQVVKGQENFDSGTINANLKNLGHGITNITRAFDDLMRKRPALARQVQKSGKTKQARKKYKITDAGIKRVQALLAGNAQES